MSLSDRAIRPSDGTMADDTLRKLVEARHYNRWVFQLSRPYLGQRLLEIGCGIGNLTQWFLSGGDVLATDIDARRLDHIRSRWPERDYPRLHLARWDVAAPPPSQVLAFRPDTAVCINILEHVEQDGRALRNLYDVLAPGGNLVLYVPALPALYGTLDRELLHVRRYGRRVLRTLAEGAGFHTRVLHYVNLPGIPGWWLNSRLLRRRHFSLRQIRLYDRLIPWVARWEAWFPPPLGQSLLYVGRKP